MRALVRYVAQQPNAAPFRLPVDVELYPQYAAVVTEPMDLRAVDRRLDAREYGRSHKAALKDVRRVFRNARLFNLPGSEIYGAAHRLE
ncbi:Bromodomain-containing protein, partial [Tribonema minus]